MTHYNYPDQLYAREAYEAEQEAKERAYDERPDPDLDYPEEEDDEEAQPYEDPRHHAFMPWD